MKSLNYYLVDVDENQPYTRQIGDIEIFNERVGADYELKPQEGTVDILIDNPKVDKGDVIIFSHMACDNATEHFGKTQYCVKPDQLYAKRTAGTYEGIERIVAKKVTRPPMKTDSGIYLESSKQEIPYLYEIESVSQDVTWVDKGDFIYITANGDYYIERLDRFFIKPENVVAIADSDYNIKKICNNFSILKPLDNSTAYKLHNNIWMSERNITINFTGKMWKSDDYKEGEVYLYKKKSSHDFKVKDELFQAVRNHQIIALI